MRMCMWAKHIFIPGFLCLHELVVSCRRVSRCTMRFGSTTEVLVKSRKSYNPTVMKNGLTCMQPQPIKDLMKILGGWTPAMSCLEGILAASLSTERSAMPGTTSAEKSVPVWAGRLGWPLSQHVSRWRQQVPGVECERYRLLSAVLHKLPKMGRLSSRHQCPGYAGLVQVPGLHAQLLGV